MELKYYLEQLSPSTLNKILDELRIESYKKLLPNDMVDVLNDNLTSFERIPALYQLMTKEEREVLSYFILYLPNQMLPYRKLDKLNGQLSRDKFEYGITKLRRKGIIYTLRKSWGDIAFILPDDLFMLFHRFYFSDLINKQTEINTKSELALQSNSLLEEELFRLLTYIHFENIPITQKGTIHRRHITKMYEQLNISEEHIRSFPIKQKGFKVYPQNIALLLDIAESFDLINSLDTLSTTKKAFKWYQLEFASQKKYLEQLMRASFRSSDILVEHLFYIIFHLPFEKWFSFSTLFAQVAKKLTRPIGKELIKRAEDEILKPLYAFGWIELIQDTEENYLFRRIDNIATAKEFYVQGNYEILVPEGFPYFKRLMLEQFGELKSRDKMSKYKLTKESILKGLEAGSKIEDLIAFLEDHSSIPLSENVRKSLIDWSMNYGNIAFMDVRVMKCRTLDLANEIKQNSVLQKWIIGEISPDNLIVKRDDFDEFLEYLSQFQYFPKKEIWLGDDANEQYSDEEEQVEFIRNKEYRIENIFPNFDKSMF